MTILYLYIFGRFRRLVFGRVHDFGSVIVSKVLEPQSDLEVSVRSIWRLSDLELLQIGNRVKFARFTVYPFARWRPTLGAKHISTGITLRYSSNESV